MYPRPHLSNRFDNSIKMTKGEKGMARVTSKVATSDELVTPVWTVTEAVAACKRLTKAHSSTFYLGSRLFPKHKRDAVHVVYAVCRRGDDAVDEAGSLAEGKANLARWWQGIERAYAGTPQTTTNDDHNALELALSWALKHFDIPQEAFYELYLGLESDLQHDVCYETLDDLMLYCRRVAGVVGFLIAPIAGYRGGEATLEQALALGQAMQLTNILRDVGEDFGKGRCYLPEDLVAKHNINLDRLRAGYVDANYVALLEELCDLTHGLYRQGWQGIPKLEGTASVAVGVAALNYESILRKLRQNHYDNLSRRAFLRTHERLVLIPRAVFSVFSSW